MHKQERSNPQSQSPFAGSEGRQSPGLEEAVLAIERLIFNFGLEDEGQDQRLVEELRRIAILAAHGAPPPRKRIRVTVDGDHHAEVMLDNVEGVTENMLVATFAVALKQRDASRRATPSQEEGLAGVDLAEYMRGMKSRERYLKREEARRAQAPASSPRDLEAPLALFLSNWYESLKAVVHKAFHACDDSEERMDGEDFIRVDKKQFRELCEALGAFGDDSHEGLELMEEQYQAALAAHPPKGETPIEAAGLSYEIRRVHALAHPTVNYPGSDIRAVRAIGEVVDILRAQVGAAPGLVDFDFALLEDTIDLAYNTSAEEDQERAQIAKGVLADIKSALSSRPTEDTPIEAAPSIGAFEAAVDNFQGACARFYCPGKHYGTEQKEMEFARARIFQLAAPGTAIEKAAREAVNARQILIQEARKHGRAYWKARRNVDGHPHPLIYKERRFACLRALSFLKAASLSSLPQEGAAGEGEGEPLPSVGEPKTALESALRNLLAKCKLARDAGDQETLEEAFGEIDEAMDEAEEALEDLEAERSDAPEGLPEGLNPSNTNATQEGGQEPKEGGADHG